jgi:uncharacterized membrane protein
MLNKRLAILQLAARHHLTALQRTELWELAGFDKEPAHLASWTQRGLALLAAALGGLALICWIAANWGAMGRTGHFVLLQGLVFALFTGAACLPSAKQALSLGALFSVGGLFAYFGQTYQTGADAWELFAIWALLGLPLCFAARSDAVWALWVTIATVAIARWDFAHSGYTWPGKSGSVVVHLVAWLCNIGVTVMSCKRIRAVTGCGQWAFAAAVTLSTIAAGTVAISGLTGTDIAPYYWVALLLFGLAAWLLASPGLFDIYSLSVVSLALNVLIIGALAQLLFSHTHGATIGEFLLLGGSAAGLLAYTVHLILELSRKYRKGARA